MNRIGKGVPLHAIGICKPYFLAHFIRDKAVRLAVNKQHRLVGVPHSVRGGQVTRNYQVTVHERGNADKRPQKPRAFIPALCDVENNVPRRAVRAVSANQSDVIRQSKICRHHDRGRAHRDSEKIDRLILAEASVCVFYPREHVAAFAYPISYGVTAAAEMSALVNKKDIVTLVLEELPYYTEMKNR